MKPFTGFCERWDRASASIDINRMLSSFVIVLTTIDRTDWFGLIYSSSILLYTLHWVTRLVILSSKFSLLSIFQVEMPLDKLLFVAFARTLISSQHEPQSTRNLIWFDTSVSRRPQRGIIGKHGWTWQTWLLPFLYTSLFVLVPPLGRGHSTPSGGQCADSLGISADA